MNCNAALFQQRDLFVIAQFALGFVFNHAKLARDLGFIKPAQRICRHLPLIRFELQPGLGVSAMKRNLKVAGVIKHVTVRPPTRSLDAIGIEELAQIVSDLA